MPRISITAANQALVVTGWSFISLHTGDPGTTGANEVSGGAYVRVAVSWRTATGGVRTNSNTLSINLPPSTTVTHFGVWSASTAGTYYLGGVISPSISTGSLVGQALIAADAISVTAS
jgi:hypothetical protein